MEDQVQQTLTDEEIVTTVQSDEGPSNGEVGDGDLDWNGDDSSFE